MERKEYSAGAVKWSFWFLEFIKEAKNRFDANGAVRCCCALANCGGGRQVSFPVSTSVFKAGGGMNYVHGGSSPQEMIVPVLDVKMERYHMETRTVQITLLSIVRKITNLITSLDFIQTEPVSDMVKAARFRIYFLSEDNEKITNENIMTADSPCEESSKRIVRLRFTFKNQKYDLSKRYYLVAYDEKNDREAFRQEMVIDIAFADVSGFRPQEKERLEI